MSGPVLEVTDLVKHFNTGSGLRLSAEVVRAVDGVTLQIGPGEVLGLVGESGSGKTTLGRSVVGLTPPTSGSIRLLGAELVGLSPRRLRPHRRQMHIVFQDPYSSLNPRMTIGQVINEPLRLHKVATGSEREDRIDDILRRVGLRPDLRHRFPHELSGGQRQRVGLARALVLRPALLVADEPVSALDVSVQAAILNLVGELQDQLGFSCLFITHDLSVVEHVSDRIAVMYLGKIVESSSREQLFADPQHPYTQALLSAAPVPDPVLQRSRRRVVLAGDPPSPIDPPSGCPFHPRCPLAVERCHTEVPVLREVTGVGHAVACHLVDPIHGAPRIDQHQDGAA
ncbi:MAG: dipeptide ABC transporter ATP-binding protein [Acidimicrobiales bacterium]